MKNVRSDVLVEFQVADDVLPARVPLEVADYLSQIILRTAVRCSKGSCLPVVGVTEALCLPLTEVLSKPKRAGVRNTRIAHNYV